MRGLALLVLIGCSQPAKVREWTKELPPSSVMGSVARGIIHLHSPFSHDACDGDGYVDGVLDEACLADLGAASRITCDDGHQVLWTVGGENELMPIMLDQHIVGDYNGSDAATADAMRAAGGTVWIPHTEIRTVEAVAAVAPSGIEVYQLHA